MNALLNVVNFARAVSSLRSDDFTVTAPSAAIQFTAQSFHSCTPTPSPAGDFSVHRLSTSSQKPVKTPLRK